MIFDSITARRITIAFHGRTPLGVLFHSHRCHSPVRLLQRMGNCFWTSFLSTPWKLGHWDITGRQINIIDNLSFQRGSHSLKFGVDYRRLSPTYGNPAYDQEALFFDVPSFSKGNPFLSFVTASHDSVPFLFHNLGVFAQDTWRPMTRLSLTYGLRWDVDFAPSSTPSLLAVTGFNLKD